MTAPTRPTDFAPKRQEQPTRTAGPSGRDGVPDETQRRQAEAAQQQ